MTRSSSSSTIVSGIDGIVVLAVHDDESIVDLAAPAKEIVKAALG